jgi:hypothetical protein
MSFKQLLIYLNEEDLVIRGNKKVTAIITAQISNFVASDMSSTLSFTLSSS